MDTEFFSIVQSTRQAFPAHLKLLIDKQVLGVLLPNYLSNNQCDDVLERCNQHDYYWLREGVLGRIGCTIAQFHTEEDGKSLYFGVAPEVNAVREWLFEEFDPVHFVGSSLDGKLQTAIDEEFNSEYAKGMVQIQQNAGRVHVDRVQNESSQWGGIIAQVEQQFSVVLYLSTPTQGGGLELYNKSWSPLDDRHSVSGDPRIRLGMRSEVVKGVEKMELTPTKGDLFIFNTHYYHRVLESQGSGMRTTALTFLGQINQSDFLFFM